MVYTHRFSSSKCSLFHNCNVFGSLLFTFYIQGVLKLKKINSGAKRLIESQEELQLFVILLLFSYLRFKQASYMNSSGTTVEFILILVSLSQPVSQSVPRSSQFNTQ